MPSGYSQRLLPKTLVCPACTGPDAGSSRVRPQICCHPTVAANKPVPACTIETLVGRALSAQCRSSGCEDMFCLIDSPPGRAHYGVRLTIPAGNLAEQRRPIVRAFQTRLKSPDAKLGSNERREQVCSTIGLKGASTPGLSVSPVNGKSRLRIATDPPRKL